MTNSDLLPQKMFVEKGPGTVQMAVCLTEGEALSKEDY